MDIGTAYYNASMMQSMTALAMGFFLIILFIIVIEKRKTYKYRKYLADLYVAAKIRFFAEEDKLDLIAEEKSFTNWNKKKSAEYREVDDSVEAELKERIENSSDVTVVKKK